MRNWFERQDYLTPFQFDQPDDVLQLFLMACADAVNREYAPTEEWITKLSDNPAAALEAIGIWRWICRPLIDFTSEEKFNRTLRAFVLVDFARKDVKQFEDAGVMHVLFSNMRVNGRIKGRRLLVVLPDAIGGLTELLSAWCDRTTQIDPSPLWKFIVTIGDRIHGPVRPTHEEVTREYRAAACVCARLSSLWLSQSDAISESDGEATRTQLVKDWVVELGCSDATIRRRLLDGTLKGQKTSKNDLRLTNDSVEKYKAAHGKSTKGKN